MTLPFIDGSHYGIRPDIVLRARGSHEMDSVIFIRVHLKDMLDTIKANQENKKEEPQA